MNAFKGSLSSREASSLVAEGFRSGFREARVVEIPQADGGDGTVEVLVHALRGEIAEVDVSGPMGKTVRARLGLLDGGKTAVIESAQASGLALVEPAERDVRRASSSGVGELLLWAARRGVRRIIVGVGGTAMNDGGIGAVQAAGGRVEDSEGRQVEPGTVGLARAVRVSPGSIPRDFARIEITAITDVVNPLLGPDGATRVYGPQKGLSPAEVDAVDAAMGRFARVLARDLGRDPSEVPRAGAGGGLSAALWAFFGARLESGSQFIMRETGLLREMYDADLVVTGEGAVDFQTAKGKVPFAVAEAAYSAGVPVIVLGGGLSEDVLEGYPPEFAAVFSVTPRPMAVAEAMAGARANLRFAAEQIARMGRLFAMARIDSRDTAAGGVVVRETGNGLEVLFINDAYGMVGLPKGHPEAGENLLEAAVREVCEETGIETAVLGDLGAVRHRYSDPDGRVIEKTVHYFLMKPVGGQLTPQEGETRGVMWVKEQDICTLKAYRNTFAVVARGLSRYRTLKTGFDGRTT
jgi:glycerate kinase